MNPLTREGALNKEFDETHELGEVEARQADRRRMNMWVLFIGVPLAVALMLVAYSLWS